MTIPHRELCRVPIVDEADTDRFAKRLVDTLPEQATIGLIGTLGAGKTRLVQGVATAAGVPDGAVTSPTFTLIQPYQTPGKSIYHIDAYRIADMDEMLELGIEEVIDQPNAWVFIEWADRFPQIFPSHALWLKIDLLSETSRQFILHGDPGRWSHLTSW
ncbi:MAG: tRNA (adenosine(37)-N6)-threonylcarbamoyltransferase complex ATPase subunit type 1 TsaE [Pirellulaceae bacterium]